MRGLGNRLRWQPAAVIAEEYHLYDGCDRYAEHADNGSLWEVRHECVALPVVGGGGNKLLRQLVSIVLAGCDAPAVFANDNIHVTQNGTLVKWSFSAPIFPLERMVVKLITESPVMQAVR
jgi:hypothetical protein